MRELRVLSPTGAFGVTPFDEPSFNAGLDREPHLIAVDAGSDDLGPHGLGSDIDPSPGAWVRHSLSVLLSAATSRGIPLIIGSAGHAGTDKGVDHLIRLVRDVHQSERLTPLTVAAIYSEVDKEWLRKRLRDGMTSGFDGTPALSEEAIDASEHIVAVMGPEPVADALKRGANVIITGRIVDDAIFSAMPIAQGFPRGLASHMGKVLECASLAAEPYMARSSLLGTIRDTELLFEPLHPALVCTPQSVASHSLYERLDPYSQIGPGGELDLRECGYEQASPRSTRVIGSRWRESAEYRVKLEGAGWCGFRRLALLGLRDRLAIKNIDRIVGYIRDEVEAIYPKTTHEYELYIRVYGRDGVLHDFEPRRDIVSHELCIVLEVVAKERELAEELATLALRRAFVARYPGQLATGGSGAMITDEILVGNDAYRWTVHHTVGLSDPLEAFRTTMFGLPS